MIMLQPGAGVDETWPLAKGRPVFYLCIICRLVTSLVNITDIQLIITVTEINASLFSIHKAYVEVSTVRL